MLLAGDIGGTKTRLAVIRSQDGPRAPLADATFPSGDYPGLAPIVREFLAQTSLAVDRACFGVAGPVVAGRATITNLPWVIDQVALQAELGLAAVRLLNDLEAVAHAVPRLTPGELYPLNTGQPVAGGALAVIAPGTGLGEAYLTWDGTRYQPHASEGGHASFAPTNLVEIELLRYLEQRFDHVSLERVCSGIGIPNLYAFLKERGAVAEPAWLAQQLAAASDPTPLIVNAGLDAQAGCELCAATLDLFAAILGTAAGNLALTVLATGGVYLGGGIPPRVVPVLERGGFMRAFTNKGRLAPVLERMPVYIIRSPDTALLGAAFAGLDL